MLAPPVVVVAAVVLAMVRLRLGLGHMEAHVEVPVRVNVLGVPFGETLATSWPWHRPWAWGVVFIAAW